MHERALRLIIVSATRQYEAALARSIHAGVQSGLLERWRQALVKPRESGLSQQSWLWAAPAKHSRRQIEELLERIETTSTSSGRRMIEFHLSMQLHDPRMATSTADKTHHRNNHSSNTEPAVRVDFSISLAKN